MENMRLTFPRNADRWHGCEAAREDGVLLQIPRYDRASAALPHDLAHYVIEGELGLTRGFWGSLHAGATFAGMAETGRRRPHAGERSREILRSNRGQIMESEVLVGIFVEAVERGWSPGLLKSRLDRRWTPIHPDVRELDMPQIERVYAALQAMKDRWQSTPAREALVLEWPIGRERLRTRSRVRHVA